MGSNNCVMLSTEKINLENLKAYSQISYRGHSQKFQNLKFSYLFVALPLETHLPKGIKQKSFW